jgi:heavy metal translocating P-type ATPase
MMKALARYWFLVVSVLGLATGLVLQGWSAGAASWAWVPWAASGAVSFGLATRWFIDAIKNKAFGSDVLAVLSIAATGLTGEWLAAAVISLMLASGRALETWAEGRAHSQLAALLARAPQVVHQVLPGGLIQDLAIEQVPIGTRILVRSGEVVPLDGTLLTVGTFDESALTGEPLPVYRGIGDVLTSGVVTTDGGVELVTTTDSQSSTYASLVRLVQQAQAGSAKAVRLANKWAVRFVPFALLLAGGTWLVTGSYENAVAVIVAATPCPLILAVPVAIIAGISKAATRGAIIKGGAALEQLARAKVILLDKTGTLTHGGPKITETRFAPGTDESLILQLAGSLEQSSPHVVATAIVAQARLAGVALVAATEVTEEHGVGLTGRVGDHRVRVGQPQIELPEWARLDTALLVSVEVDGKLKAIFGLDDPVREESANTIRELRGLGVDRLILVSGDRESTVAKVAQEVGADQYFAQCTPEHKLQILRDETAKTTGIVVAVGDGINDAPALAAAGVGVAMGARGATAASEAADVVIIEDSIKHLAMAVDVSQGARNRALQASGFGMSLAIAAMVAASVGILDATASAVAQEFIDAAAILWALVPTRNRVGK